LDGVEQDREDLPVDEVEDVDEEEEPEHIAGVCRRGRVGHPGTICRPARRREGRPLRSAGVSAMTDARMPTLSEHESKTILGDYGVPIAAERVALDADDAVRAAESIGFPVVVKLCGAGIAHKTERNLVRLGVAGADAVRGAAGELLALRRPDDGEVTLLV